MHNPEETVAEVWSEHGWNIVFRRHLNDWEIGKVAELLQVLNGLKRLSTEHDSITLSDGSTPEMESFLSTDYMLRK